MNKDLKQPWIDALRSGKYRQTKETLKNKVGHCCLGVLCELNKKVFECSLRTGYFDRDDLTKLQSLYGLDIVNINTLAGMNDSGKSFDGIANYIENNL